MHWSFLLGHLTVIALAVLVLTGIVLTIFYRPSSATVIYDGSSELFHGRELPHAYASIIHLSHDVPGGLLLRRLHAVAAHLFIAAGVAHLLRVLLTGAFRAPRRVNYLLGLALILAGVAAGWTGENLTYSLVSGNSIRVGYAVLLSVPIVGEPLATLAFGGPFPAGQTLPRLWAVHVIVFPALLLAGTWLHLWLSRRDSHTQPARPDIDDDRFVVGEPFLPEAASRIAMLALLGVGVLVTAAILVPWSDIALEGPYRDGYGTTSLYPPWYLFWPEGAMILLPGGVLELGPLTFTTVFFAGVALPGAIILVAAAYPFLYARRGEAAVARHALEDPRSVPARVGTVTGVTVFLAVLTIAAGSDVVAQALGLPIRTVVWGLRVLTVVAPLALGTALYALVGRAPRQVRPAWSPDGTDRSSDGERIHGDGPAI